MRRPAAVGPLVLAGQVALVGFLAVAVALHPGFVFKADEGGISNYGIHLKTAVPYSLAFLGCAGCSLVAARRCPAVPADRSFAVLLDVYAALLLVTLASTYVYTLDHVLKDVHLVVGTVLLVFQFFASVWLYAQLRTAWDAVFLGMQAVGSAVAGLTVLGAFHLLFGGQALADLGFALLLVHRARRITPSGRDPHPTVRRRPTG